MSCSQHQSDRTALTTVSGVDLERYSGRWYEMARLPNFFQKANEGAIAEYQLQSDGLVGVRNVALRPDGSTREIRGSAEAVNPPDNSKLKVRFHTWFGWLIPTPREGNYWILHLDPDYQEAIVGTPNRKFLWVLTRASQISEGKYQELLSKASALGFATGEVIKSPRPNDGQLR